MAGGDIEGVILEDEEIERDRILNLKFGPMGTTMYFYCTPMEL